MAIPFNNILDKLPLIKDDCKNQDNQGGLSENYQLSSRRKTLQNTNHLNSILNKFDSHRNTLKYQNQDQLPELKDIKYSMSEIKMAKNVQQVIASEYSDKTFRQNKFISLINLSGNDHNQEYINQERQAANHQLKNKGSFRQPSVLTKQKDKKDKNRFHFIKINHPLIMNKEDYLRDKSNYSAFDATFEKIQVNVDNLKKDM